MKSLTLFFLIALTGVRGAHALDLNNNGMSDVWERIYNVTNPNLDPDGDGQSNLKEAQAGTNPNDPQDFFRTTNPVRAVDGTSVTLSWRSVQDRYYEIEESSDLVTWNYADYAYGDSGTETTTTFYPSDPSAPRLFWRVRSYPEYDYDDDGDSLDTWEERLLGTDPYDYDGDTDNDGMDDGFEFIYQFNPLSAADGTLDTDGDLLSNAQEAALGLNPRATDTDGNGVSDANEDRDFDGLTNLSEITTHQTDPAQNDTDGDGLSDGWEILYGFSALVNNETDADPTNDPDADPDGDGLNNGDEDQINTNPENEDTDGDGASDALESQKGSNPTNPASTPSNPGGTPGGPATPPPPTIPVQVNFGDHSGSHSEKYRVYLEPLEGDANTQKRYRTNRKYGQTQTETFNLPAGAKYKVTLVHIGTDPQYEGPPKPDYDYTLEFTSSSSDPAIASIPEDPAGMLGVHDESQTFFASGKDATLYVAWLTSETVATLPTDRKRKKLGVGEEVNLTLKPASLPSPTWALSGTPGTSTLVPLTGTAPLLTAGERACTPTTEATISGTTVKIDFNVVEPTGVVMEQEQGTGVWHIQGVPSAGFKGRAFLEPFDVSFTKIEIREGQCAGTGIGYYAYLNGSVHPDGSWGGIIAGTAQRPSKDSFTDQIQSGADGPASPASGSFDWPIPWLFRVGSGAEKTFTTVTHHQDSDASGKVTISKGGHSVSKNLNDPTSNY